MKKDPFKSTTIKRRLAEKIERSYLVRFHMLLMLSATVLSGAIFSKLLLLFGVSRMPVRYGIAIILSYMLFFLFVKLWLLYIGVGRSAGLIEDKNNSSSDWTDLVPSPLDAAPSLGEKSSFIDFGGGSSGGGGASGSFADSTTSMEAPIEVGPNPADLGASDGAGEGIGSAAGEALDVGDEFGLGLIAVIILAALILFVFIAGGYLIWFAPTILSEAAFEVLLVTSLAGKVRQAERTGWETTVFKATWWIFLILLIVSIAFGIIAQQVIPNAVTAGDLFTAAR